MSTSVNTRTHANKCKTQNSQSKITPADAQKNHRSHHVFHIKPRNIENLQIWTKTKWNQSETTVEQSKVLLFQNQFLSSQWDAMRSRLDSSQVWALKTDPAWKKQKNNQLTCVGKRWNKLACKPERGRARSLWETADESR